MATNSKPSTLPPPSVCEPNYDSGGIASKPPRAGTTLSASRFRATLIIGRASPSETSVRFLVGFDATVCIADSQRSAANCTGGV